MSTSGFSDVPRLELDMVVNTIHTIMEEHQHNDGSKVYRRRGHQHDDGGNKDTESRPEINSAAAQASIQLLRLIPCWCSLLWCKFGLVPSSGANEVGAFALAMVDQ